MNIKKVLSYGMVFLIYLILKDVNFYLSLSIGVYPWKFAKIPEEFFKFCSVMVTKWYTSTQMIQSSKIFLTMQWPQVIFIKVILEYTLFFGYLSGY